VGELNRTFIILSYNGFYRAAPGPDPCTGLCVPIGNRLAALFQRVAAAAATMAAAH
jgi:hypothetical protein